MKYDIQNIALQFQLQGDYVRAHAYGSGHIHDTFEVVCDQAGNRVRYILQRINHDIFKDVPSLMENIARTTGHIRDRLKAEGARSISRRVLTLVRTLDETDYHEDADGNFWRVYMFIERAQSYDVLESPTQAYEAAKAFGRFQDLLSDLPAPRLNETLPRFHDTRARYDALMDAVMKDACGRAERARDEIAFALERERMVDVLLDLHRAGELPERTTHNDTKLNNVLIDDDTQEGVCVIDLDTVMPGLALYDFGDMIRTGTSTAAEDEPDLSKVLVDRGRYEALFRGYLETAGGFLATAEKEWLPFSGKLITFETGIRFLTDYLEGDTYFKVSHERHNLDRCRNQFRLLECLEEMVPVHPVL